MSAVTAVIRDAVPADLPVLSGVALRSKAHWGYDAAFLEACRDELTITRDRLQSEVIRVADDAGVIAGFHSLLISDDHAELMDLFVDPRQIGSGIGTMLFADAVAIAGQSVAMRILIEADPHAEAWYLRRGACRIGEAPSGSIPGRALPLLEYVIDPGETRA